MNSSSETGFVFTGRHMLAIMIAFFGVIISVNVLMAYLANSSWSGILAKNTYVASQEFNLKAEEARKWAAEGFKGDLVVKGGELSYTLTGPKDILAKLTAMKALFHRPVGEKQDFALDFTKIADGQYVMTHKLAAGQWIVDLAALEGDKTVHHQAIRILIPES